VGTDGLTTKSDEPAVAVKNICFSYGSQQVLSDVSFEVPSGSSLMVIGMSGCGKTTLLRCLNGLVKPQCGDVLVQGKWLAHLSRDELYKLRLRTGYVFQDAALFDSLTVFQNVAFPLVQHLRLSKSELADRVHDKLQLVGLSDVDTKYPDELSGGMRKRAAIARSLVMEPSLLLYDEPTAGLDPIIGSTIDHLVDELKRRLGVTSVVVTHYIRTALEYADKIMLLHQGIPRFFGTGEELRASLDPFVHQFLTGKPAGLVEESLLARDEVI
jgi:phospholipid/cholesterol/gamma-HCH transport system ATP-binding protein